MMPNKTIYVKDADLPFFEQAQQQFGDSVSSMFAEFLRDRVARLTPEEGRMIELIDRIQLKRQALNGQSGLPGFLDSEYAEAQAHAKEALKSLRAGEVKSARIFFHAASAHLEWAERDLKNLRELRDKLAEVPGAGRKSKKRRAS